MATLSIVSLLSFFLEEKKSIKKGENDFKSDHIEAFTYQQGVLRGEVHASMKQKVYKVTIYLDEEQEIKSTECECPRGAFKCNHAAALFIHGIHNLSRTDVECQWRKRKANTSLSTQAVTEMFPPPKKYSALSIKPTQADRSSLYEDLKEYGRFTGLCWLISPEPPLARCQVQGELYFSQRNFCYFVVWTTKDIAIVKIERDETWVANIPVLMQFYFDNIFPRIVQGEL
ncbi:uncharacterized protein LOC122953987 [Acropora millepora]|uniref:uncharacterized protein LOC122953987 n=1 Tax=Acropora millepora TaxID=45264 RepID=UPI001CF4BFBC|nr:uncharacterized protein LOC122953987 [Acropora millepora]